MVSLETVQNTLRSIDGPSSPRISFSAEFLDEGNFISITPKSSDEEGTEKDHDRARNAEFEFLSSNVMSSNNNNDTLLTADELFFEGKLLPFWQIQHSEKLKKICLKPKEQQEEDDDEEEEEEEKEEVVKKEEEESKVNWFVDDDPSPRPPNCTVLWKELLKLKKQRASSSSSVSALSPSSSFSSSSSSSSASDMASKEEGNREKQHVKRVKKGLERTRSASIRIRPMINVPICSQVKSTPLPPLFSLKKGR